MFANQLQFLSEQNLLTPMYAKFYGLATPPFQLTPDARFFFESTVHRQAMAYLVYGLHHAEGFIIITGEVGAGKTILVDNLLSTIDQSNFVVAKIVTTQLAGDDLLHLVAGGFGIAKEGLAKGSLLQRINDYRSGAATQRQTRVADRRRGAEPVFRGPRRVAHAVQHHRRQDHGVTELFARPAAVPCDPRQPAFGTAAPAGDRGLSFGAVERGRDQGLYRAPVAPGGLEGRSAIHRRLFSVDLSPYRRRTSADQHTVFEVAALRLSGRAPYASGECRRKVAKDLREEIAVVTTEPSSALHCRSQMEHRTPVPISPNASACSKKSQSTARVIKRGDRNRGQLFPKRAAVTQANRSASADRWRVSWRKLRPAGRSK